MKAAAPLPALVVNEVKGGKLKVEDGEEAKRGGDLGLGEVDNARSCGRGERLLGQNTPGVAI